MRYTLRADEIQNVDNDASVFIQDEEGERTTSLVGQTFSYDRRDERFLPSEGYYLRFDQDLAGFGGDNRYLRHEGRAEYYYSIIPDVVVSLSGSGGYIRGIARRGRAPVATASSSAATTCAASSSAASARAIRRPTTRSAAISTMSARPSCASRWACPRSCAFSAAPSSTPARCRISTSAGPTLDESNGLRVAAGVGLSWLSPLGPLSIDFAQAVKKEDKDKTEFFRAVLRHPVLMTAARRDGAAPWLAVRGLGRILPAARLGGLRRRRRRTGAAAAGGGRGDRLPADPARRQGGAGDPRSGREPGASSTRTRSPRRSSACTRPTRSWRRQRSVLSAEAFAEQAARRSRARWPRCSGWRRSAAAQLDQAAAAALNEVRTAMIEVVGELAETRGFNLVLPSSGLLLFSPADRSDRRDAGPARPASCRT